MLLKNNYFDPPSYNSICLPEWIYNTERKESEQIIRNHIQNNNLGIYSDRLFLIRKKNSPGLFVISVYRFNSNDFVHYLLNQHTDRFTINENINIYTNDFNILVKSLIENEELGHLCSNEIIPLCRKYVKYYHSCIPTAPPLN